MSTAVVPYAAESLSDRMRYAETLASAADLIPRGLWATRQREDGTMAPPSPSPGKVLLVLETGAMLGVHPVAALQGIHIIENKATISPALMSAVVRGAGHTLRVTTEGSVATGDLVGIATLIRKDDPEHPFEARFSLEDALQAELIDRIDQDENGRFRIVAQSDKGNALAWQKTPRNLVKRRAISEVCRDGAEDVLMGVHYTPEEVGATVDDTGEYIPPTEVPVETPDPAPAEPSAMPPKRKRATRGAQGVKREKAPEADTPPADEPAEPSVPAEDIVDAEVVEDEPSSSPDAATDAEEAERVERERIAQEQEHAARAKAEAEEEFALQEPPMDEPDWDALDPWQRLKIARTPAELKAKVWDAYQGKPEFTKDLSEAILQRKKELEQQAATEAKPPSESSRAAVLED